MTITREDVADLRPGDVVRLSDEAEGWTVEGAVWIDGGALRCGPSLIRYPDSQPSQVPTRVIGVVSRAPRPLYVNHPRTEPVPGDVVRDVDDDTPVDVWVRTWGALPDRWAFANGGAIYDDAEMPARLRLLVDGETGRCVQ